MEYKTLPVHSSSIMFDCTEKVKHDAITKLRRNNFYEQVVIEQKLIVHRILEHDQTTIKLILSNTLLNPVFFESFNKLHDYLDGRFMSDEFQSYTRHVKNIYNPDIRKYEDLGVVITWIAN